MPKYRITATAGEYIAGRRNTGVGTTMFLTPREAAHDLRVGSIEPVPVEPVEDAPKASKVVGKKGGKAAG